MEFVDGQESNEAARMDTGASSRIENSCEKEDPRKTDGQSAKANRRRNTPESI
jgi:hypothetical protein